MKKEPWHTNPYNLVSRRLLWSWVPCVYASLGKLKDPGNEAGADASALLLHYFIQTPQVNFVQNCIICRLISIQVFCWLSRPAPYVDWWQLHWTWLRTSVCQILSCPFRIIVHIFLPFKRAIEVKFFVNRSNSINALLITRLLTTCFDF